MFVLRVVSTDKKGKMQGNEEKEINTDEIQNTREYKKIPVRARFFASLQTGPGPTQPPIKWVPGLFPGGKAAGVWR